MEYYQQPEDIKFEFYEQVDPVSDERYVHHEKLDFREDGLSEEGVQKLSEDFFNPLPSDNDEK